jgi:DNA invertase Pin-like site-specific DNA recombinase
VFDTLIADADGVYHPANDRRLLGLKETMSEAELHILKARMLEGRRAKARRGELGKPVPMGYLRYPSSEIVFDPDEPIGSSRLRARKANGHVKTRHQGRLQSDASVRHSRAGAWQQ